MPNPVDLTTVPQVQAQLGGGQTTDSALLQVIITAISRYILTKTGRRALNGTQTFTLDKYDGNGNDKLYLMDFPIQNPSSLVLQIFGNTVNQSPDGINPGWIVGDMFSACLVLLPGTSVGAPISQAASVLASSRFPKGRQNIWVTYSAGYATTGGPGPHPPSDPTFNGAPSELGQAVTEFVVMQYKRRDWVDQAQKTMTQTGESVRFGDKDIPPFLKLVIDNYTRTWWV